IEEVDRFREFRPVSAIGVTLARKTAMKEQNALPDEEEALALAERLNADTVAAIATSEGEGGDLFVQAQVFTPKDPGGGIAGQRLRIAKKELDSAGPARIASNLLETLKRHWGGITLTMDATMAAPREMQFDIFRIGMDAEQTCIIGRFDVCERVFRQLL